MKREISPLCALSLSLTVVLLLAGLAAIIAEALVPNVVLPALDIPALAALSLIALALETVIFGHGSRAWVASLGVAVADFGLLILCTGRVSFSSAAQLAVLGGVVFLVCEMLFHSILDRLSSGAAKNHMSAAAVLTAVLLWLACQGLAGIGLR